MNFLTRWWWYLFVGLIDLVNVFINWWLGKTILVITWGFVSAVFLMLAWSAWKTAHQPAPAMPASSHVPQPLPLPLPLPQPKPKAKAKPVAVQPAAVVDPTDAIVNEMMHEMEEHSGQP